MRLKEKLAQFSLEKNTSCRTKTWKKDEGMPVNISGSYGARGVGPTLVKPVRKAYICLQVLHLRLPGIAFQDGWFVTDKPKEQAHIEQNPLYGREIFSWPLEPISIDL